MLRGAHAISLDSKGRLAIPTRYRGSLHEECDGLLVCTIDISHPCLLVCTIDISHPCLLLYPLGEWELIEKKLRSLSSTHPQERRLKRLLLGHAAECELDGNGRLLVPGTLRQHAELEKKIMLVGQLNRFEVWSESRWQQQINDDLQALESEGWESSERLRDFSL